MTDGQVVACGLTLFLVWVGIWNLTRSRSVCGSCGKDSFVVAKSDVGTAATLGVLGLAVAPLSALGMANRTSNGDTDLPFKTVCAACGSAAKRQVTSLGHIYFGMVLLGSAVLVLYAAFG